MTPMSAPARRTSTPKRVWAAAVLSVVASVLWATGVGSTIGLVLGGLVLRNSDAPAPRRVAMAGVALGIVGILVFAVSILSAVVLQSRM